MITHKSVCGLCKPEKRWKRNRTKIKSMLIKAILNEDLSANLVKSYEKMFKE